jgi:arylsulfatase A-like enzyme
VAAVRVAFFVLDGLPRRHLGPEVTPNLWALACEGAAVAGRAVMTSATYPNHATFATGAGPEAHGLVANWVVTGEGPQPAQAVGPRIPTIFDACRAQGRTSVAVVGDQNLVAVMGAGAADAHWPPGGVLPAGVAQDAHGYAADAEVVARLAPLAADPAADLVVGHLNEPDTAGHVHGPDGEAAVDAYRASDARLGEVLASLRPRWADTVVIVVSDHDMEAASGEAPVDLYAAAAAAGVDVLPIPEGNAAVVWGADPTGGAWLDGLDGVASHREVWPGARLVDARPGRWFALPPGFDTPAEPGHHGGSATRAQVAVVGGGHPAAGALAAAARARGEVAAADWAPTVAALLGVRLPHATGRALV